MAKKVYYVTKTGGRLNIPLKNTILHIYEKLETEDEVTQGYLDEHVGNGLELDDPKEAKPVKPVETLKVGSK